MRQRKGFGNNGMLPTVLDLADADVLDLLEAMPFLAPILPVPSSSLPHAAHGQSHRTPRRSSRTHRTLNTPRASVTPLPDHNITSPSDSPRNTGRQTLKRSAASFGLSPPEVELATRAWLQVLGDVTALTLTTPQAFSKACSVTSILHEADALLAALGNLHVPVLPVLRPLAQSMLTLLRDPSWTTQKPGIHFLTYLRLLCQCKHLDALRRHRERLLRGPRCRSPPRQAFGESTEDTVAHSRLLYAAGREDGE